jgi:hypothetical protein
MKKGASAIIVCLLLAFIAFLETPTASINKRFVHFYSEEVENTEVSTMQEDALGGPILDYKLEDAQIEEGYLVEIYREYEIYKDRNGEIIKTVATNNLEYLKYALSE